MVVEDKIKLQIAQLNQAVSTLAEAAALEPTQINKDATIQRFEYCFELAWKLMQSVARVKGTEVYNPRDSIRTAAQNNLIDNAEIWFEFLKSRNTTVHIYNQEVANQVYQDAKRFLMEAQRFLENLPSTINEI